MYSVGIVDLNFKVCGIHHCSVNGRSYLSVQRYPRLHILCLIEYITEQNKSAIVVNNFLSEDR